MRGKILSIILLLMVALSCNDADVNSSGTGQGGSMTKFAISGAHLYILQKNEINVFNIGDGSFKPLHTVQAYWGMETIIAKGEHLYLGARDGMYIYSIANPDKPAFVFRYEHVMSCDPVAVQGNRAYVTLRTDREQCRRPTNTLDVIDITNPLSPVLIKSYDMMNPHGLAVDGNLLFICEGKWGLKAFDITNERIIQLVGEVKDIHAYDVIAKNGVLTVTGEDGIFQYQYQAGMSELVLLSSIPVLRTDV